MDLHGGSSLSFGRRIGAVCFEPSEHGLKRVIGIILADEAVPIPGNAMIWETFREKVARNAGIRGSALAARRVKRASPRRFPTKT